MQMVLQDICLIEPLTKALMLWQWLLFCLESLRKERIRKLNWQYLVPNNPMNWIRNFQIQGLHNLILSLYLWNRCNYPPKPIYMPGDVCPAYNSSISKTELEGLGARWLARLIKASYVFIWKTVCQWMVWKAMETSQCQPWASTCIYSDTHVCTLTMWEHGYTCIYHMHMQE